MPTSSQLSEQGFLSVRDLALMCRVFDAACQRRVKNGDPSWDVETMGQELIAAYQRGVRVEEDLVRIAISSVH
jgi:hypothetical protein